MKYIFNLYFEYCPKLVLPFGNKETDNTTFYMDYNL